MRPDFDFAKLDKIRANTNGVSLVRETLETREHLVSDYHASNLN
jgi:hypothetical protein